MKKMNEKEMTLLKKYSKDSELTFEEVAKDLPFIKVYWNSNCVFDDDFCDDWGDYAAFVSSVAKKKVYEMKMVVAHFHHCVLFIEGEDLV